jgi:mRNA interferase MazF
MNRGDVVIVDFPFSTGAQSKVRPALIVQNDRENRQLSNTIIAMITGNLTRANQPTHYLVDPATAEGASSNLHGKSLVSCINLFTIEQASIVRTIGRLSSGAMTKVDGCLQESPGLFSAPSASSAIP